MVDLPRPPEGWTLSRHFGGAVYETVERAKPHPDDELDPDMDAGPWRKVYVVERPGEPQGFVVAENEVWLSGSFDSLDAAIAAFDAP